MKVEGPNKTSGTKGASKTGAKKGGDHRVSEIAEDAREQGGARKNARRAGHLVMVFRH